MLRVENAVVGYYKKPLINIGQLQINPGEMILITGENGAGKTTFAESLQGQIPLLEGKVDHTFTHRAYVPQSVDFDTTFPLSLYQVIAMGMPGYQKPLSWLSPAYLRREREAVMDIVQRIGLEGKEQLLFFAASGGQFRRALIARALVSNPGFILLDEPFANLDDIGMESIADILMKEKEENDRCLLLIDHIHPPNIKYDRGLHVANKRIHENEVAL